MLPPIAAAVSPSMALANWRVVNAVIKASRAVLCFTLCKPRGDKHKAPKALGKQQSASAEGDGPGSSPSHASRNTCGTFCCSKVG